jgi:DNA-binding response OmpR family regulator
MKMGRDASVMKGDFPRIAVIEDDPDFGIFMTMLIETRLGGRVMLYTDGLEGLIGCLNAPPDLVVLDLELPTMHGEEILRRLRSSPHTRHIPIMICSAMADPQKQEMATLRIGADCYLEKTFDNRRLVLVMKDLLINSPGAKPLRWESSPKEVHPEETPPEAYDLESKDPAKSSTFAGYRILRSLGAGGMGTVYEAAHPRHGIVAIKVLLKALASNRNAVERFLREERTMRALEHPNIIRILDSGKTAYSYFFTMEVIRGESLDRLIDRATLPMAMKRSVISQAFEAVAYLHSRNVLHRDLKPSNFILGQDGSLKVGDFGISWNPEFTAASAARLTRDATLVGTPAFMAPEQLSGAEANPLTDQYALARTIQCVLEGARPSVPPRLLSATCPDLPAALSNALSRMLDIHPERRFPTILDAKQAVMSAMEQDPGLSVTPAGFPG